VYKVAATESPFTGDVVCRRARSMGDKDRVRRATGVTELGSPDRTEGLEGAMRRRRRADQDLGQRGEPADGGTRYLLREKLLSIGDDFWIENDQGERIFHVDAKVLRVRDTVVIKDRDGNELVKLQKRLLRARDTMAIERDRDKVATVKKAIIAPLRDRFTVDLAAGGSLEAQGNILDHEYQITRDGIPVANISKRWFRVRESYGVAVAPGQDDALVLAVTVCIDHLTD
jgi:uncharacterized protein YxjI